MKRRRYLLCLIPPVLVMIIIAVINFNLSFAMFDLVNAAQNQDWTGFNTYAIKVGLLVLIMMPFNLVLAYVKGKALKKAIIHMKMDYLTLVYQKDIRAFQKENNAKYLSAMTHDFNLVEKDYLEQFLTIFESVINFTTAIVIITVISPVILLMGLVIVVFNALISILSSKPIKKHNKERSDMMDGFGAFIKEVLSAFHIIKTNDLESRVKSIYQEQSTRVQNKKYVIDKIMSFIFALQNTNFMLTFLALMFAVSYLTITGVIVFAGVVVVAQNIDNIIGPVAQFSEALPRIFSVNPIFMKMKESLKDPELYEETQEARPFQTQLSLNNVTFAYEDTPVLKDVNLAFEKGKKYLIIGPSGGGKSTLLKLLRKYLLPTKGDLLLDDMVLKDIKKASYYKQIANIEQHVFLFEDTLRNNITLYKDYSDEAVLEALHLAGLSNFLLTHKEGLDYPILDNGKNVSGGEKSRIAIARALLNKAEILFIDEAFAALDAQSARQIEHNLLTLNITLINVSHVIHEEHKALYDQVILVKGLQASPFV